MKYITYNSGESFLQSRKNFDGNVNVKLGLSNHITPVDLKATTRIDTSELAAKIRLS